MIMTLMMVMIIMKKCAGDNNIEDIILSRNVEFMIKQKNTGAFIAVKHNVFIYLRVV